MTYFELNAGTTTTKTPTGTVKDIFTALWSLQTPRMKYEYLYPLGVHHVLVTQDQSNRLYVPGLI